MSVKNHITAVHCLLDYWRLKVENLTLPLKMLKVQCISKITIIHNSAASAMCITKQAIILAQVLKNWDVLYGNGDKYLNMELTCSVFIKSMHLFEPLIWLKDYILTAFTCHRYTA